MRLYYTKPLEAAYMDKEFGVRFVWYASQGYADDWGCQVGEMFDWLDAYTEYNVDMIRDVFGFLDLASPKRIYVHPDDCRIFEPKENDQGVFINAYSKEEFCFYGVLFPEWHSYLKGSKATRGIEPLIIRRDGKHFFMPEEEIE